MKINTLVSYILTLTPEQIDKICERLPQLEEILATESETSSELSSQDK